MNAHATITAPALSAFERDARAAARDAVDAVIANGARIMLEEPWRLHRALYEFHVPASVGWEEMSADCDAALARYTAGASSGHWAFSGTGNRIIALRQARMALDQMAAADLFRQSRDE